MRVFIGDASFVRTLNSIEVAHINFVLRILSEITKRNRSQRERDLNKEWLSSTPLIGYLADIYHVPASQIRDYLLTKNEREIHRHYSY